MGGGGEVDISDVTGDATMEGDFYGPIRAQDIDKTMRYTSSRSNFTLAHLSGQMEMDSGDLTDLRLNGSFTLRTANKDVMLDNINGRIDLTDNAAISVCICASAAAMTIRIADESGNIDITFPRIPTLRSPPFPAMAKSKMASRLGPEILQSRAKPPFCRAVYGTHGPHITLNTTYGTISIHKAE